MLKTTSDEILEGPILATLVRLVIPTTLALIFYTGFNFVDRFFVSRLGEVQLGAVGMAFPVQAVLIAVGNGLGSGASSLIARFVGAKEFGKANRVADQALFLVVICALVTMICGLFFMPGLFNALGASAQMRPYILSYLHIILVYGAFSQFLCMIGTEVVRGEGDTVTPMWSMLAGTLTNIILDPILIFGLGPFPALGIQGAAIATVAAQVVSCMVLAYAFLSRKNLVHPTYRFYAVEWHLLRGILAVGGPTVLGYIVQPIGISLFFFLLKPYGDVSKTTLTMGMTYQQLGILPIVGMTTAVLAMTGQNFGARRMDRVRRVHSTSIIFTMSILAGVAVLFIVCSSPFASVFSDDPEAIATGKMFLIITSLGFPFIGSHVIHASIFQGLGKGINALLLNISQMVCFSLPLAWWFSNLFGLNGIWWGMTVGFFLSSTIGLLWMWNVLGGLNRDAALETVE